MGRQNGVQLVATPKGELGTKEAERSLFESIVGDLRHAIEQLSTLEGTADAGRLSWVSSSALPPLGGASDSRLFEAWDLMMPEERRTVIRAVLADAAPLRQPGQAHGTVA